jgi:hypothetical protein
MSRPEVKTEEVYLAHGEAEAQVIKAELESYDIPAMLVSNAAPSVHVFTIDGLGEYRVFVPTPLARQARELLEDNDIV